MDNSQAHYHRAKDVLVKPFSAPFLKYIWAGIVVGLVTGLVVSVFRWIIDQTLRLLTIVYPFLGHHPLWLLPYVLGTILVSWLIGRLIKADLTDLVGSGVPQIEAILCGQHRMNWWTVLWRKFVSGLLTICPGLFLGREGPCIQIGACIGQGLAEKVFKLSKEDEHLLLQCGVAAGLSAAFSAPLAGTVFLLEEVTHRFQAKVWVTAFVAAIAADAVTFLFFGAKPCLYLPIKMSLPTGTYPWLIVLGVVVGALAFLFQYFIFNLKWWYRKFTVLPNYYHSILPLLLVIPVGLWNPHILGSSHNFIMYVADTSLHANWLPLLGMMVLFLVLRFFGTMLAYGATVPGGIFMPIFVLGSVIGAIAGIIMIHAGIIPASCYLNIIAISMAAYFGAAEGVPFSAILLVTEMVGTIQQVFPMMLLTFVAYYTSMLLGARPSIYDALRQQMVFEN
ncbi:MAG: ClC family H(+)/Cl(-) exchange transporter [Limosilactobacillus sp.]|uniref:ClC family H(+)/Cl(-) exchange transporter n=1 Tax=Limosilactobacillus sp. TaxID=2773925 RepID=UPI002A7570FE|nr:ClC family H(+)/Cl(-) exchange transporter [Limosilactobacillus sp.]MDD7692752.1 ClC family H(+)/Cl(-) exchange transporter [Lactobacillaceae bacterium]MDY2803297.1 ClC family H(+)/Cl(-) exchange transporter [Limosilactobacillus sp.]